MSTEAELRRLLSVARSHLVDIRNYQRRASHPVYSPYCEERAINGLALSKPPEVAEDL